MCKTNHGQRTWKLQYNAWLTLGAHAQRGLQYLVCVFVCLSTAILAVQAMVRPMSNTSGFRTTRVWKLKRRFSRNDCIQEILHENKPILPTTYLDQLLPVQCTVETWSYSRDEYGVQRCSKCYTTTGAASPCLEWELSTISWTAWPRCACVLSGVDKGGECWTTGVLYRGLCESCKIVMVDNRNVHMLKSHSAPLVLQTSTHAHVSVCDSNFARFTQTAVLSWSQNRISETWHHKQSA